MSIALGRRTSPRAARGGLRPGCVRSNRSERRWGGGVEGAAARPHQGQGRSVVRARERPRGERSVVIARGGEARRASGRAARQMPGVGPGDFLPCARRQRGSGWEEGERVRAGRARELVAGGARWRDRDRHARARPSEPRDEQGEEDEESAHSSDPGPACRAGGRRRKRRGRLEHGNTPGRGYRIPGLSLCHEPRCVGGTGNDAGGRERDGPRRRIRVYAQAAEATARPPPRCPGPSGTASPTD